MKILKLLALSFSCLLAGNAVAAEFNSVMFDPGTGEQLALRISGPIVVGDAAVFASAMKRFPNELRTAQYVTLNSPGGNLGEAVKLGRLLRKIGYSTIVEKNARCVSACFILYASGLQRLGQMGDVLWTSPEVTSIGVHRAFIDPEVMKTLSSEEARKVVREGIRVSNAALAEFDVPEEIIALVAKTPAAMVRYLSSEQLKSFYSPPWWTDLTHARCDLKVPTVNSGFQAHLAYEVQLARCEVEAMYKQRLTIFPL